VAAILTLPMTIRPSFSTESFFVIQIYKGEFDSQANRQFKARDFGNLPRGQQRRISITSE
jgi:hypothetical protein